MTLCSAVGLINATIFAGMFTINFKREFRRCCCCFKSKKKDITPHPPEGRSQMSQRRGFLQGAYCSTKASSSSSRPILEQPNQRSLKYSRHDTNNGQSSSASLNAWSQQSFSESRANINNFMSLRLPVECDIVSVWRQTYPWTGRKRFCWSHVVFVGGF